MKIIDCSNKSFDQVVGEILDCKDRCKIELKTITDLVVSISQALKLVELVWFHRPFVTLYLHDYNEGFYIDCDTSRSTIIGLLLKTNYDICSKRTKAALQRRRDKGLPLGRPKGALGKKKKP